MFQKLSTTEDLHTERTDWAYLRWEVSSINTYAPFASSICTDPSGCPITLAGCRRTKEVRIDFRRKIQAHLSH